MLDQLGRPAGLILWLGHVHPNLTPEALSLLKTLINNPHAVPDGPALQELFAAHYAIGKSAKAHATSNWTIFIQKVLAAEVKT